jgi:hypothetical protein
MVPSQTIRVTYAAIASVTLLTLIFVLANFKSVWHRNGKLSVLFIVYLITFGSYFGLTAADLSSIVEPCLTRYVLSICGLGLIWTLIESQLKVRSKALNWLTWIVIVGYFGAASFACTDPTFDSWRTRLLTWLAVAFSFILLSQDAPFPGFPWIFADYEAWDVEREKQTKSFALVACLIFTGLWCLSGFWSPSAGQIFASQLLLALTFAASLGYVVYYCEECVRIANGMIKDRGNRKQ